MEELAWEVSRPRADTHHFHPHSISYSSFIQLYLTSRECGKCSLTVCPGRGGLWVLQASSLGHRLNKQGDDRVEDTFSNLCDHCNGNISGGRMCRGISRLMEVMNSTLASLEKMEG